MNPYQTIIDNEQRKTTRTSSSTGREHNIHRNESAPSERRIAMAVPSHPLYNFPNRNFFGFSSYHPILYRGYNEPSRVQFDYNSIPASSTSQVNYVYPSTDNHYNLEELDSNNNSSMRNHHNLVMTAATALTNMTKSHISPPKFVIPKTKSMDIESKIDSCKETTERSDNVNDPGLVQPSKKKKVCTREKAIRFPIKLMNLLSSNDNHDIISWTSDGKSFVIKKPSALVSQILPTYFKESKYSSFTRKLSRWGFVKILRGKELSAYHHPKFQRDNIELCNKMQCGRVTIGHNKRRKLNNTEDYTEGASDDEDEYDDDDESRNPGSLDIDEERDAMSILPSISCPSRGSPEPDKEQRTLKAASSEENSPVEAVSPRITRELDSSISQDQYARAYPARLNIPPSEIGPRFRRFTGVSRSFAPTQILRSRHQNDNFQHMISNQARMVPPYPLGLSLGAASANHDRIIRNAWNALLLHNTANRTIDGESLNRILEEEQRKRSNPRT